MPRLLGIELKNMKDCIQHALKMAGGILMSYFGKISEYTVKESQSSIVTKLISIRRKKSSKLFWKNFPIIIHLAKKPDFKTETQNLPG